MPLKLGGVYFYLRDRSGYGRFMSPVGQGGVGNSRNWKANAIISGIFILVIIGVAGTATYDDYVNYSRIQTLKDHGTTVIYTISSCSAESKQPTWTCSGSFSFGGQNYTTGLSGWPRDPSNPAPRGGTVTEAIIDPSTPRQYAYVLPAVRGPSAISSSVVVTPAVIGATVLIAAVAIAISNHKRIKNNIRQSDG